jgi:hypothetical protein
VVKTYRDFLDDSLMKYLSRAARASINVGVNGFLSDDAAFSQIIQHFKLLPFKKPYEGRGINIIVGNARTHSEREYSVNEFGEGTTAKSLSD